MARSEIHAGETWLWRILPDSAPDLSRLCGRCRGARAFLCTDKFRVNANGKRLDAWLIYRCTVCHKTWNRPILERVPRGQVSLRLLEGLQNNDPNLVFKIALDRAAPQHNGEEASYRIECSRERGHEAEGGWVRIRLELPHPFRIRLEKLLARELGVSRSRLKGWEERGQLTVSPPGRNPLRKTARDGQIIELAKEIL